MPTRLAVLRAATFHTSSALPAAMVVPWSRPVISPALCWTAEVPACSKVQESFQPPSALASDGAGSAAQLSIPTSEGAALTPATLVSVVAAAPINKRHNPRQDQTSAKTLGQNPGQNP